jgi:glycosyltransferase involved in cell wall biosynthesis
MKFSIITPTHNVKYIGELYESIKSQSYLNWEWILYLNGGIDINNILPEIRVNPNVKIYRDTPNELSKNIGYLKHTAFNLGTGDVLIEADHDDMLTPDCLTELAKAYQDQSVGFVYSNVALLGDNMVPYNPAHGWTYETFNWKGKDLRILKNPALILEKKKTMILNVIYSK